MMTRKNEYLFPIIIVVAFITWLLLGSFVVSKDIFDLCYFLLGLLCEEEAMAVTEGQWFRVLHKVFRGYTEINPLQLQEIQAVPYVMKSIELLFIAWFFGQKDMKCCEDAVKLLDFVDRNTKKILSVLKDFEE
jgi:hypothetical protein